MHAVVVIQARMGSTRLPGKVLRQLGDRPVLSWVIRAARAAAVGDVYVATTTDRQDDSVADLAATEGVRVIRGSKDDVLSRFVTAAQDSGADYIVRLTADCPFLDPALIRAVAHLAAEFEDLDYASNTRPPTLPQGLAVELVTTEALMRCDRFAVGVDRTHVTSYIYTKWSDAKMYGLTVAPAATDLRVTLDTIEDAAALDAIVEQTGSRLIPWRELIGILRSRPDICAINDGVMQKKLSDG